MLKRYIVRELKHVIERTFNFIENDVIDNNHLPDYIISLDRNRKNTIELDTDDKFIIIRDRGISL